MTAVVFGAGGAIGSALVEALARRYPAAPVIAASRNPPRFEAANVVPTRLDPGDEDALRDFAAGLTDPARRIFVAVGALQDQAMSPEKSWRALDLASLQHAFHVNAVLPALIAKHMLPRLPREGPSVFAALSARVGSIGDNRLGGWYAYRASKAALNQLVRTLSIELSRTRPEAVCVSLHPGTVETPLSRPHLSAGTQAMTPAASAAALLDVVAGLTPADSGGFFAWDGRQVPY